MRTSARYCSVPADSSPSACVAEDQAHWLAIHRVDVTLTNVTDHSPATRAQEQVYAGRARSVAAAVCFAQGMALLGFCAFYAYELTQGEGDDLVRVAMSIVLMAVFAAALVSAGVAWLRGVEWAGTPTVVWNVLLLPVAWGLLQSGRGGLAAALGAVAIVGIVAALGARPDPTPDDDLKVEDEQ